MNLSKSVVVMGVLCFIVAMAAVHLGVSRAEMERRNAELDKRVTELQQEVNDGKDRERTRAASIPTPTTGGMRSSIADRCGRGTRS